MDSSGDQFQKTPGGDPAVMLQEQWFRLLPAEKCSCRTQLTLSGCPRLDESLPPQEYYAVIINFTDGKKWDLREVTNSHHKKAANETLGQWMWGRSGEERQDLDRLQTSDSFTQNVFLLGWGQSTFVTSLHRVNQNWNSCINDLNTDNKTMWYHLLIIEANQSYSL